jgi:hypothetical protein
MVLGKDYYIIINLLKKKLQYLREYINESAEYIRTNLNVLGEYQLQVINVAIKN